MNRSVRRLEGHHLRTLAYRSMAVIVGLSVGGRLAHLSPIVLLMSVSIGTLINGVRILRREPQLQPAARASGLLLILIPLGLWVGSVMSETTRWLIVSSSAVGVPLIYGVSYTLDRYRGVEPDLGARC